mmetsp:Transcript_13026/g.27489  ORF Transcript_13026/g.27489 Transcript_13026/m.27489 type:complete len:201 (+) Transcript_13026:375-977(+)
MIESDPSSDSLPKRTGKRGTVTVALALAPAPAPAPPSAPPLSARCFECASWASWRSALVSSWLVSQLVSSSAPPAAPSSAALALLPLRGRSSFMLARFGLTAPAPHAALFCLFSFPSPSPARYSWAPSFPCRCRLRPRLFARDAPLAARRVRCFSSSESTHEAQLTPQRRRAWSTRRPSFISTSSRWTLARRFFQARMAA